MTLEPARMPVAEADLPVLARSPKASLVPGVLIRKAWTAAALAATLRGGPNARGPVCASGMPCARGTMPISIACDCGKQLRVKDELAGRRVKCPECGEVLTVPGGAAAQPRPPAPKSEPPRRPKAPVVAALADEDDEDDEDEDEEEEAERPRRRRRRLAARGSGSRLSRDQLYRIALYQKIVCVCILCYLLAVVGQFMIPPERRIMVGLAIVPVALTAVVFVFLLATAVYSAAIGVVYAILTLIPCVGLIMLLVINAKATSVLKSRGYSVGLLGASLSQFR